MKSRFRVEPGVASEPSNHSSAELGSNRLQGQTHLCEVIADSSRRGFVSTSGVASEIVRCGSANLKRENRLLMYMNVELSVAEVAMAQ